MVTKYVFAFPGQGAQTPGMMRDMCTRFPEARAVLDAYSAAAGIDIPSLLWDSTAEELARTDKSQTAITAASLAAVKILETHGVVPAAVAGFSLGEWGAMCVSGVLTFEETAYAVKRRGEIMQRVCDSLANGSAESGGISGTNGEKSADTSEKSADTTGAPAGMSAIIGLAPESVQSALLGRSDVFAVNLNSVKQTVIAGTAAGLAWAADALKQAGARRVIPLSVAGPFHSPLMQQAAADFVRVLDELTFKNPRIALFSNVTGGRVLSGEEAKANAVKHIVSPVLWTKEEQSIAEWCKNNGETWQLIETGPGKTLCGFWRDTPYAEMIPQLAWEDSPCIVDCAKENDAAVATASLKANVCGESAVRETTSCEAARKFA